MSLAAAFIEELAAWATLGTAIGTALLAGATFVLAQKTSREVEAATKQAEESGRQVVESARQAEAAERALRAQTRPLITDVPWGVAERVKGYVIRGSRLTGERFAQSEDASVVSFYVLGDDGATLQVPFRNIGNGAAVVQAVQFVLPGDVAFTGVASTPMVPPGEIGAARLEVGATAREREVVALYEAGGSLSVLVGYADADGAPRGAVRFDLHGAERSQRWRVRQVFWAETLEAVQHNPTLGSQPLAEDGAV